VHNSLAVKECLVKAKLKPTSYLYKYSYVDRLSVDEA